VQIDKTLHYKLYHMQYLGHLILHVDCASIDSFFIHCLTCQMLQKEFDALYSLLKFFLVFDVSLLSDLIDSGIHHLLVGNLILIRIHCEIFFVVRKGLEWLMMIEVVGCIDPWQKLLFRVLSREY
jgi:hypothetical protein